MRPAIVAGIGIGILPVRYAADAETAGELVRVLPAWQAEPIEINAFYLDGNASSRKTRLFLDFATDLFKRR